MPTQLERQLGLVPKEDPLKKAAEAERIKRVMGRVDPSMGLSEKPPPSPARMDPADLYDLTVTGKVRPESVSDKLAETPESVSIKLMDTDSESVSRNLRTTPRDLARPDDALDAVPVDHSPSARPVTRGKADAKFTQRIPAQLLADFTAHCRELGVTRSVRIRDLMVGDLSS